MKIKTPTLLIDQAIVKNNIRKMLDKVSNPDKLRPHFKTHQSIEVGEIFKEFGITKITVSSVSMAKYFSQHWNDITIAFTLNLFEIDEINQLNEIIKTNILVESLETISILERRLSRPIDFFIKIDTGYNRTGMHPNNPEIEKIINMSGNSKKLNFKGFLTHAGNTYNAKGSNEILDIMERSFSELEFLSNRFNNRNELISSYGDTPSCSMASSLDMFDEIRPGNFTYYDIMQYHIGSCEFEDIATVVACPVVAIHPERNEIVILGGAVHLSKEHIQGDNNFKLFGYVVEFIDKITYNSSTIDDKNIRWGKPVNGTYVKGLSQEHGIISASDEFIQKTHVGDLIGIMPVHSCLTANLLKDNQVFI